MKVAGIDVVTGSVRSRTSRPVYALALIQDGKVTLETRVSLFRLMRFLVKEEPDVLAVDSIQEIAADRQELLHFMQHLPPRTRLVQVTGGEKRETLGKVAARYNISFNRFDPAAEARTAAVIASLGGGMEVVLFANTCDVVVSRHRSIGKGGWSQNRYIRKIHGAVLQKAREIERGLATAGLTFEKKESRAFGGASRVAFHIYAPREMVPIRAQRGPDVQVRISGKALDRIAYRPLSARPRHIIVGLDPGTTTAWAALLLDGQIAGIGSSRQSSMSDTIETLMRLGKPLVIASDVREMPYSVEKIRRAFQAVGYTPRQDRSVEEKQELTQGYTYRNVHERDALAAALDAFRHYRHRLQNVVKRIPQGQDLDEVWAAVIRGLPISPVPGAEEAPISPESAVPATAQEARRDERVAALEAQVKRLRGYVGELEERIQEREQEIGDLQLRLRRERSSREQQLRRDSEIAKRDLIILNLKRQLRREQRHSQGLRKRIQYLRSHGMLEREKEAIPLKVLGALTRDGVRALKGDLGIGPEDVLYLAKTDGWGKSAIRELADEGVRAVVIPVEQAERVDPLMREAFHEHAIPLVTARETKAAVKGKTGVAHRQSLDQAIAAWEEEQKRREMKRKAEMVEAIFREYRIEREREVHGG